MKNMNDRKMDMGKSSEVSDGYFPTGVHRRVLPRAGEVQIPKYPDTDQMVHADQNQAVKAANSAAAKPGFRH